MYCTMIQKYIFYPISKHSISFYSFSKNPKYNLVSTPTKKHAVESPAILYFSSPPHRVANFAFSSLLNHISPKNHPEPPPLQPAPILQIETAKARNYLQTLLLNLHPPSRRNLPREIHPSSKQNMPPRKSTSSVTPADPDESIQLSPSAQTDKPITATEQQIKARAEAGVSVEVFFSSSPGLQRRNQMK